MTTLLQHSNGWHPGEKAIHSLLKVPTSGRQNPTASGLPASYAHRVTVSSLLAVGTLDDQGRPWTCIWGGERGFARAVAQDILAMQSLVNKAHDPVVEALLGSVADGEVLQPEDGTTMSALSIDLETRDRVKLAGKMVVGSVATRQGGGDIAEAQLAMLVQESLGNCPKYLNRKTVRAHVPSPHLVSSALPLPSEALALIQKADMFFLSSTNGQTMDTNHRGGPAGFVRVVSNSPIEDGGNGDGVVLVYPEYSGNRLYQTLGNLHINPLVGIVIPDFETSDVLYLTGETQVLVGSSAAAIMPHTSLAVKIKLRSARFVKDGLSFRGTTGEPSPYNPPVRRLASERPPSLVESIQTSPLATATLVRREPLTPSIARFTFRMRQQHGVKPCTWQAGQHITLSFASELDMGWSHMNDADPQSLNDDFVRTFTISNPPPSAPLSAREMAEGVEVQLTLRRHGAATNLLFAHPLHATAAPLEVPVLGIAGEARFRIASSTGDHATTKKAVFVAGGIGITPLLAQAPGLLAASSSGQGRQRLEVLWSLRAEDLVLAVDAFEWIPGLGDVTRVFVTGVHEGNGDNDATIGRLRKLGARVDVRRIGQADVLEVRDTERGTRYFACANPRLLISVMEWLAEEEVAFESFEY
ncbi:uncharacterized protein B0T15DRAFT_402338 [Chaetomium strumarium]|uniref:FAD-binding FR-type domain-containing protein n=1 Tax=Chaetomium strumarium TaxID=1170767 RepID=A0AAJ0GPJ1_9PEZI|nr:hypothetical protein B0T15DRAFT_402338 [Chaetomium strumarium]